MFVRDADDQEQRRRFTRRALIVGAGQLGALGLLVGRLYQLQVMDQDRYALLADDNRLASQVIASERGRILDRAGTVLADNIQGYRVGIVPARTSDLKSLLQRLARIIPLPADEQEKLLQRARRQPKTATLVVNADITFEQVAEIGLNTPYLPGVETDIAWRRRTFHGRDIGFITGIVGAIERPALDDDPVVRLPGFRIGKSGVERAMETELRGRPGQVRQEVDARGRIVRTLEQKPAQAGRDISLTIEVGLQAEAMARLRQERRAALVALDVTGGEILAMCSQPVDDPGELVTGEAQQSPPGGDDPMMNRAIQGLYPPGSTFKMVTALAALDMGRADLRERIDCDGDYVYADQTYRCWKRRGHGRCDLHRALRESCDCYFYELARRTGIDALSAMARRLGFGQTFECGIAQQRSGLIPTPDWKRARFGKPWHGGETILAGIGQGFVLTTPLQLAVMTARLATGMAVEPTLIRRDTGKPQPLGLQPQWLDAIRRGLAAVVNEEGGTGHSAQLSDAALQGIRVAGKTGTSQVHRASTDRASADLKWEERDHSLFVAYAPAEKPSYAVAVVVEHGGSGSTSAAPLARDVLEMVLKRDPGGRHTATTPEPNAPPPTPLKSGRGRQPS